MTRDEYMKDSNPAAHHTYYLQFSEGRPSVEGWILQRWSIEKLKELYSQDPYLNNLGLGWMQAMDMIGEHFKSMIAHTNKKLNGESTYSKSDNVCMIKARMIEMIKE